MTHYLLTTAAILTAWVIIKIIEAAARTWVVKQRDKNV